MRDNSNISVPGSGMNRDKHPQDLSYTEYAFALNATIEGDDGSTLRMQNEPSMLLCKRFDGYKVIGYKNDVGGDNTYFFITNPADRTSKIVFMRSLDYYATVEDQLAGSGKDIHRILGERLEDGDLTEICGMLEILIEDDASDPCLNFDVHHPIYDIEIKEEKCGKVIYWTDDYNPPRYVEVDKALTPDDDGDFWYHYHGYKLCGDDTPLDRCVLACEKLRIFPELMVPMIDPEVVEYGGSLRAGTYQFCVALCDEFGIEKTSYGDLTNPITLFDEQDVIVREGIWGKSTNLGIRLKITNLDRQASHYKIGVIENTVGFNGELSPSLSYFIEGIHPISESTVYFMTDQYCQRTTAEALAKSIPVYRTSRGLTASGNRLLQYGLTVENEWNLQPVTNLMGHFLHWFSSIAREDLYKDGVACSKYASLMRDEVYPFGIRFFTNTGYYTSVFPLIPRPATDEEMEDVGDSDAPEVKSVRENNPECAGDNRRKRWQYYNTAKVIGPLDAGGSESECKNLVYVTQYGYSEEVYKILQNVYITMDVSEAGIGPEEAVDYMVENTMYICENGTASPGFCEAVNADESEAGDGIPPYEFPGSCNDVKRDKTETSIVKNSIENPRLSYTYKSSDEMEYSDVADIVQNYSQEGAKLGYMFEYGRNSECVDLLQSGLDSVAEKKSGEIDKGANNDDAQNKLNQSMYAMSVMKDIAEARDMYMLNTCSRGCTIQEADVNPSMNEGVMPTYMPARANAVMTWGIAYQRSSWHDSGTDTVLTQVTNENEGSESNGDDNYRHITWSSYQNMTYGELYPGYSGENANKDIEGLLRLEYRGNVFDTRVETEWESVDGSVVDVSDTMTLWTARNNRTKFKFYRHVNESARWIKLDYEEYHKGLYDQSINYMIFEILGNYNYPVGDSTSYDTVRVTFWSDTEGTIAPNPFAGGRSEGALLEYVQKYMETIPESSFKNEDGSYHPLYVSIEAPYIVMLWAIAVRKPADVDLCSVGRGFAASTGVFPAPLGVGIRKVELDSFRLDCDKLSLSRLVTFSARCTSCGDKPINCAPRPYEYGDFGYWESTNKYPANFDLYDSSVVSMSSSGGAKRGEIISKLTEWYGSPSAGEDGKVSFDAVFCQKPIRHYRVPDNVVSRFMSAVGDSVLNQYDSMSYIYPIGVMIDDEIVSEFLDIAVESGLITRTMRDSIAGYEIFRGDRRLDRSVIATGLGYDMIGYVDMDGNYELHANYPYNDLSDDRFIYNNKNRESAISHPFHKEGNVWYSFVGPDISFNKPDVPVECSMEGFQTGAAMGVYKEVDGHPKWVILGRKALSVATALATAEALMNMISSIAEMVYQAASQQYVGVGLANFANPAGIALTIIRMTEGIARATTQSAVDMGKYRYQWQTSFLDMGPRRNYAYYYTSAGNYNSFVPEIDKPQLRAMSTAKYIKGGLYSISDISSNLDEVKGSKEADSRPLLINNIDRESSLFLSFGKKEYMLSYRQDMRNYDGSRVMDSCDESDDPVAGSVMYSLVKNSYLASPYLRLRRYLPAQYGDIDDIKWMSTGGVCNLTEGESRYIYGGDIYISRFSIKRKFPMFSPTQYGMGDMIPFAYNNYRNVGFPRYFVNFDTSDSLYDVTDSKTGQLFSFPSRESSYNLSCQSDGFYAEGKFYLFFYGISQFLCESEINCNYRVAPSPNMEDNFYPNVGDYERWTQERFVPISMDEKFLYPNVYAQRMTEGTRKLPATYDKRFWDCAYQRPNGVIWSTKDVSENGMTDPWLSYRPMDYHEFKTSFGRLVSLKGIESEQVLARFENQVALYNAIDVLADRITPNSNELGTGGLFASRGIEYNSTDLGYSGTQSRDMVSCEFGHFWVDMRRGQVFKVDSNGRNLKEVTPGMRNWFKEHLQMKILRSGIFNEDTNDVLSYRDIDNKFMGIGLSLGWDNRFKRVLITKKDYMPVGDYSEYRFKGGDFYRNGALVDLRDPAHFTDVSFTVTYNCLAEEWKSYMSYTPDYYIERQHYLQSGLNYAADERMLGLWSHGLTNQSYQVFYGKLYPFIVEVPVREQFVKKILTDVRYRMDARRYQDEVNYQKMRTVGFDKLYVYNDTDNSGELRLVMAEKGNMMQQAMYPITAANHREILATEDNGEVSINDFFNEVKDNTNNIPVWIKDVNDIEREIDPDAIDYRRPWRDRLRGDWFLARFLNTVESRFKMIVRWFSNNEKVYR